MSFSQARRYGIVILLLFPGICFARSTDVKKQSYAQKIQDGFLLQSIGETRAAFYSFRDGYQEGLQAGENAQKLELVNSLFIWYRKYGFSAGIMTQPALCRGEYISHYHSSDEDESIFHPSGASFPVSNQARYESEWGKNPEQAKHIRQFIGGVGLLISGIFVVSINPPFLGPIGKSMCLTGFTQMCLGLNNLHTEWEERIQELKEFELKTKQLPETQ